MPPLFPPPSSPSPPSLVASEFSLSSSEWKSEISSLLALYLSVLTVYLVMLYMKTELDKMEGTRSRSSGGTHVNVVAESGSRVPYHEQKVGFGDGDVVYDEIVAEETADGEDDCCVICSSEKFKKGEWRGRLAKCGHEYHKLCIDRWLFDYQKDSCPICRRTVFSFDQGFGSDDEFDDEFDDHI